MIYKNFKGKELSTLGMGCMRLPCKDGEIDVDATKEMVAYAMEKGINYYDTAYVYSGSESAIGEIFERNHMRDKINIATKLPQYLISSASAVNRFFDEELYLITR